VFAETAPLASTKGVPRPSRVDLAVKLLEELWLKLDLVRLYCLVMDSGLRFYLDCGPAAESLRLG